MSEIDYYSRKDCLSNSALGWLQSSPKKFMQYLTGDIEFKESISMERGTLLHKYIESPADFVVSNVPKVSGLMGKFIEELARITPDNITNIYKEDSLLQQAYNNTGFKWSSELVVDNLKKPENLAYYQFLRSSQDKISITTETKKIIDGCIKSLHSNPWVSDLLFKTDELGSKEYYTEYEIYWEYDGIPLKSKLDRIIIDHGTKTIKIIDLKTTNKSCYWSNSYPVSFQDNSTFRDSFIKYRYYRQLAFYNSAIDYWRNRLVENGLENLMDYDIENIIIPIETSGNYNCCVLKFSTDSKWIKEGNIEWKCILEDYKWHLENNLWEYPRYIYENQGIVDIQ